MMTIYAFKDNKDGYYQVEIKDGETLPLWTQTLIVCEVQPTILEPQVVLTSKYKLRKALNILNLRTQIEDFISTSTDQDLKDAWLFADEFRSDDPLILQLGNALGKTEAEIKAVFELANTL